MHEMSIATSLMSIVREEMDKHGAQKLLLVRVCYGALSNIVPEALEMAFEVANSGTDYQGAKLELNQEPVKLACGACKTQFSPAGGRTLFAPCPACGQEQGHMVLTGKSLYIEHIEVE